MIELQGNKYADLTPPGAKVDNAGLTVSSLDCKGFGAAEVILILGALDIGLTTCKLQESDDNATWVDLPNSDYSLAAVGTLPSASDSNHLIGWSVTRTPKRQRYLRPAIVIGNGSTGAYATVFGILGRSEFFPTSATDRGLTQVAQC
jgi:hypothetical protein